MKRARIMLLLALLAPLAGGCAQESRLNVLIISLCSVRPDHMSLHGYVRTTTPQLAAFARNAVVFDRAVTQWPKTAPAFAALMTGRYPHSTGVMRRTPGQHLADEHQTLAEILGAAGYETAAFSSTPAITRRSNILQGFDHIDETYRLPRPFVETAARALSWMQDNRGGPFLAWVHFNNAHYPYRGHGAPEGLFLEDEHYDASRQVAVNTDEPLELPVPAEHPFRKQLLRPDIGGVHPAVVLDERPTELDFYVARYDAGIYGADRLVGELLDDLDREGLLEGTIIVIVGDHGESMGEHDYFFEHGRFPYEDCARVPLIIRPPGEFEPRRVADPVSSFALAPTVLELAGLPVPPFMEAASLVPQLHGQEATPHVFIESGYHFDYILAVREGSWKLIHVPNPLDRALMAGTTFELYDLASDPGEELNLIEAQPEIAARLKRVLDDWSREWLEQAYRPPEAELMPTDPETLEKLRSLGYVN